MKNNITNTGRHDPFLTLRAIACLAIIWAHIQPTFETGSWLVINGINLSLITVPNPFSAVFIFFLISGYAIGSTFTTGKYTTNFRSLLLFYFNRILRIVPIYYLCLFVSIAIFYHDIPLPSKILIRFLTFTANDSTKLPILFPYAIVSTEMQFYVLAPFLFILLKKITNIVPPILVAIAILFAGSIIRLEMQKAGMVADEAEWTKNVYTTVLGNIDIFLSGMFVSIAVKRYKDSTIPRKLSFFLTGVVTALLACWYVWFSYLYHTVSFYPLSPYLATQMIVLLPLSTIVLFGLCFFWWGIHTHHRHITFTPWELIKHSLIPRRFLSVVGTLSFALYLWHWPIFDIVFYRHGKTFGIAPALYRFIVVVLLALGLSIISYILVEYPILKLKNFRRQKST